jgi:hypothetical protein
MECSAKHRAHRRKVGIRAQEADHLARIGHRCVSVEWKSSFRRESQLISAREQERSERFAHSGRHHHHVEQHCRGNGDAEHRQESSRGVPPQ